MLIDTRIGFEWAWCPIEMEEKTDKVKEGWTDDTIELG